MTTNTNMNTLRKLTTDEIENILSVIPINKGIPHDVALSIQNNQKKGIRKQLLEIMIYPPVIESLKQEIEKQFYKTKIQPGEAVGIITAQSIGERQTQSTLNSFHHAGISMKTTVTGVPRFSELINATKEPKAVSATIYFTHKFEDLNSLRKKINHTLIDLRLENIIMQDYTIHNQEKQDEWKDIYRIIYGGGEGNEDYVNFVRFKLNTQILWEYSLTTSYIKRKIEDEYDDIKCVFSPDSLGLLDIYFKDPHIEEILIPALYQIKISEGISGISSIFPEKKGGEWIIETDGSNLPMLLSHDLVDSTKTISNNMWEIYNTLGIEAARNFLVEEFAAVVSSDGTYVNDSHIKLLVDIMTFGGSITSISRYGLKKENCGPLAKASFEESLENFTKAGLYGEIERIEGVSASVMLGKITKTGTGICDILVDIQRLPKPPQSLEPTRGVEVKNSILKDVVEHKSYDPPSIIQHKNIDFKQLKNRKRVVL